MTRSDRGDDGADGLDRAHPGRPASRLDGDVVAGRHRAVGERPGDDRPASPRGEDTVDPQARPAAVARCGRRAGEVAERRRELVDTDAHRRGHRHHRRPGEERAGEPVGDLEAGQLHQLAVVEQVDLGQGHDAVTDSDQLEDPQVLLALRLPPLGGGDDEQAGVDAADAGQHVAQEPDVSRHVDEADRLVVDDGMGEAEIDRQPAALLLGEAVGIGPGERQDERRLAVVDVPGRGDHPHRPTLPSGPMRHDGFRARKERSTHDCRAPSASR